MITNLGSLLTTAKTKNTRKSMGPEFPNELCMFSLVVRTNEKIFEESKSRPIVTGV